MSDELTEERAELATASRILAHHQLVGMFGHVSLLTEDPQQYLISPGAGTRKDRCRPTDVLLLDLDHEFAPGLPLELYMHSELHREKPHLRSLVHVHSPGLVALSAMAEVPTELLMLHASFWPEEMPLWEEAELVRDRDAAQRLIAILGDAAIALLRWHGAVIVGATAPRGSVPGHPGRGARPAAAGGRVSRTASGAGAPRDRPRRPVRPGPVAPTHDMHWNLARTYVELEPGARGVD